MNVYLYNMEKPSNYLTKSSDDRVQKVVEIYGNVDILNPVLIMEGYLDNKYNYALIPRFNSRCYYITKREYLNGFTYLYCAVDVLMSWRNQLLEEKVYIERNEKKIDDYRIDGLIPTIAPNRFRLKKFNTSFSNTDKILLVVNGGNENV